VVSSDNAATELAWPNGARLRLLQAASEEGLGGLHFASHDDALSQDDLDLVADLSERLGVALQLSG
jgi:hypothetical protein